jgi:hypothetical protein
VPKMNNNLAEAVGKSVRHGLLAKIKHGLGGRIIDGDLLLEVRGSDLRFVAVKLSGEVMSILEYCSIQIGPIESRVST